jgi:hypothetical protein
MREVFKRGHYFGIQYVTGPQILLLMLDLQSERIADPFVTALSVCQLYGQPDDTVVRSAVLRGSDEANAEFGTKWHPLEIKYSYSGYDNLHCSLMSRGAYDIIKTLAQHGAAAIKVIPERSETV